MDALSRLTAAAQAARDLKPRTLAVYVFLLANADESGAWWGTFDQVADALGSSWSPVARAFRDLVARELIIKRANMAHGAAWVLIWRNRHSGNDMAFPPTPPLLPSLTSNEVPPPPARRTRAGGGGNDIGERKPNRPDAGEGMAKTPSNVCYVKFGDRTDEPTPDELAEAEALLAGIRDKRVRDRLARAASPALIRTARRMVEASKNVRDFGAMLAHLLTSGSALAEHNKRKDAQTRAAETQAARAAAAREALEAAATERRERERETAIIAEAGLEALRESVAAALGANETSRAAARTFRYRVSDDTPEEALRLMARNQFFRSSVAEHLGRIAAGGPRVVPSPAEET